MPLERPPTRRHACFHPAKLTLSVWVPPLTARFSSLCLQTASSALQGAIQLGIGYTVGNLSSKPERDVLMQDFYVVESIFFPRRVCTSGHSFRIASFISNSNVFFSPNSEGSNLTPAHHFSDFRFKTYAPVAFRYFRELFGIRPDDYLVRRSTSLALSATFVRCIYTPCSRLLKST